MDDQFAQDRNKLFGSLLFFTQVFFKMRTGRAFDLSQPIGRESHYISICRELVKVFRGETTLLVINIPPRYGKTELLIHFVAWALARYPDSNFLYLSYSHNLAAKQTSTVRDIINLREYQTLFDVSLSAATKAKFNFETTMLGSVYAAGIGGTITGRGAGIKGCKDRFGGAIIIDDAHKPAEAHSDTVREGVIDAYKNTIVSRRNNGVKTPIIYIGQRVHEEDLANYFIESKEEEWKILSLAALDSAQHALHPGLHAKKDLLAMQSMDPYTFAAQFQQNPQPAGGGIFKEEWFRRLNETPPLLMTFITADTAETDKDYNDKTVFSFWGLFKIKHDNEFDTGEYGLLWIDCVELQVEPKDLKDEFMQFYHECLLYAVKPKLAAIEKKSTGVTLSSVLSQIMGLQILKIERTKASGSKTTRFLSIQKYIAGGHISILSTAKHAKMCIEHCGKITANNTHRHDDIADTLYDAIKLGLIDQTLMHMYSNDEKNKAKETIKTLLNKQQHLQNVRRDRKWDR